MKLFLVIAAATSLCAQSTITVTGRITDSVTGLPVEQATITLDQGSFHQLVSTDASGNFVFDEVPPGTATAKIRKENYLPFEITNPDDISFEITPDRHEHNFKLTPAGTIRGRITADGKPEEAISVSLMKEDFSAGFRQWIPYAQYGGDIGPDRSFEITGLAPGRYIVKASPEITGGTARELICGPQSACAVVDTDAPDPAKDPAEGYTVTWYPGVTTLADAAPIILNAGETQTVEFKIARRPLFHISGKVALPESETDIRPLSLLGNGEGVALALANDGEFRFRSVPPGQYTARGMTGQSGQIKRDITVTDHDIEGITLAPQPRLEINGRFRMANADVKLPVNLSVQIGPALPADSQPADAAGSGTFILSGFPDDYSVQPVVPSGYAVTEIRYAGVNYLNRLIPINGNTIDSTLTIVLSNQPATVSGSIDGDAKAQAKIVLAPYPIPENFDLRSLRVTTTDKDGAFSFTSLPPGKYKSAVLTGDDRKRDRDLTILNDKFSAADVIELTAGQSATIAPKP